MWGRKRIWRKRKNPESSEPPKHFLFSQFREWLDTKNPLKKKRTKQYKASCCFNFDISQGKCISRKKRGKKKTNPRIPPDFFSFFLYDLGGRKKIWGKKRLNSKKTSLVFFPSCNSGILWRHPNNKRAERRGKEKNKVYKSFGNRNGEGEGKRRSSNKRRKEGEGEKT